MSVYLLVFIDYIFTLQPLYKFDLSIFTNTYE